jgi:hypothetical protein
MIKGCGMELLVLFGVFCHVLGQSHTVDPGRLRHETLTSYCEMIKHERIYRLADLENTCVMKVSVFDGKVRNIGF